jgi:hypothetical protein
VQHHVEPGQTDSDPEDLPRLSFMQKLWKKFKRTGTAHKNDSAVKISSPFRD